MGHIKTGGVMGRGNQYIQLVKVLYCKLLTIGKQLPSFAHRVWGFNCSPQRLEANVLMSKVCYSYSVETYHLILVPCLLDMLIVN